jgi:hypothetical protein
MLGNNRIEDLSGQSLVLRKGEISLYVPEELACADVVAVGRFRFRPSDQV